jgi:uncharacterized membrane protein
VNAVRRIGPFDVLTVVLLAAGFVVTAAVYGRLPDPMPTHFGLDGRANGWMPRHVGAWALPATAVVVTALARGGAFLLRGRWRARLQASPVRALALAVAAILLSVHVLVVRAALSPEPRLGGAIWVLLGVFFVVLGLLMPRIRRNPWFGVRTAWTLSSDENWARTHRMAGYSMSVGGFVAVLAGLLGSSALALVSVLVSALLPALWSWYIAQRDPDGAR